MSRDIGHRVNETSGHGHGTWDWNMGYSWNIGYRKIESFIEQRTRKIALWFSPKHVRYACIAKYFKIGIISMNHRSKHLLAVTKNAV